jgi:hypothetical protein
MKRTLFLLSMIGLLAFITMSCDNAGATVDSSGNTPRIDADGDSTCVVECKNNDNGKVPNPGCEFSYDRVSVVLTEEASILDKVWAPSDFPEFAFSEIYDIGLRGLRRFLTFYLTEPSRDNVLRAIYKLRARTEVCIANVAGDGRVLDPCDDFSYDRVIVVLTEEASLLDKVWTPSDFQEFAFSEVYEIGLIGPQNFLIFYLTEPSRDNVRRAVCVLRARTEVFSAGLNMNLPGGGGGG